MTGKSLQRLNFEYSFYSDDLTPRPRESVSQDSVDGSIIASHDNGSVVTGVVEALNIDQQLGRELHLPTPRGRRWCRCGRTAEVSRPRPRRPELEAVSNLPEQKWQATAPKSEL